jgi:superfamily II DNA or RNA helicase
MNELLNTLQARAGVRFFDYQLEALARAAQQTGDLRRCLFYKTGAGKSLTGLSMMAQWGVNDVVVITPPSTFEQWVVLGLRLGVKVTPMSHAKYRMKDTRLSRSQAVIVDEFHLLGGHGKQGWKKLDTMARHLKAPLLVMSATPNYNDAERVYCIQHVIAPHTAKGGYLEFLYKHCETEASAFGVEPIVLGFRQYPDAAAYLAALDNVDYLPDDLVYQIKDIDIPVVNPPEFSRYGLNRRTGRIIASQIEERHAIVNLSLIGDDGYIRQDVYDLLAQLIGEATTPVLVFAAHSTVADALDKMLAFMGVKSATVTGSTPAKKKQARIEAFKDGVLDVLVGTATLATGTDGLDKMCDYLLILDDTDDASLRRQLIGRIMPRGEDTDASGKHVFRLLLT